MESMEKNELLSFPAEDQEQGPRDIGKIKEQVKKLIKERFEGHWTDSGIDERRPEVDLMKKFIDNPNARIEYNKDLYSIVAGIGQDEGLNSDEVGELLNEIFEPEEGGE